MTVYPVATIVIGDRDWFAPAALAFALCAVVLVATYAMAPTNRGTRLLAALPKAIAFLLLAACLIEPLWSSTRARPGENLFLVLADNSSSLTIQSDGRPRGDEFAKVLSDAEAPWQVRLAQDFDVRRFQFDGRTSFVEGAHQLDFSGTASSIYGSLTDLAERYDDQPVAGILLFTDGTATDVPAEDTLAALPPVYPVLPSSDAAAPDLSVIAATATETVFEDAPITLNAQVIATSAGAQSVVVQLLDDAGQTIEEQRRDLSGQDPLAVRFQARPVKPGLQFYTIRARRADETDGIFDGSEHSQEPTLANNVRIVEVNREGRPYRVLYVGGRPNWEYRFLRRALRADSQIDLVALIRIARKEAKFDFRGREGESSNPLFRGFKEAGDEETESYDEPVLIRQGTRDEAELRDGFPKDKATLYAYDAIILDDVEAAFFTHDQLSLIERFVTERGGGLMMLGGVDTFQSGKYARTPVADALPVYLDRSTSTAPEPEYRLTLTRDGWLQPWIRLRSNEPDEQRRLGEMPSFATVTRVESIKPGAQVLATLAGKRGSPLAAIAAQRYGAGRTLAVMIGDLWRWSMHRASEADDDLAKMWRQSVRWLVSDLPRRLDVAVQRRETEGPGNVNLVIRVRNDEYQPEDNADLEVTITQPDGQTMAMHVDPSLDEPGLFTTSFRSGQSGAYRATVQLKNDADGESKSTTVGWTSNPAAEEFRRIDVNREAMDALARETGGEVVAIEDLEAFAGSLPYRRVPRTETWTSPLWHRSWVLGLVLICLAAEWGLRRWRGLA